MANATDIEAANNLTYEQLGFGRADQGKFRGLFKRNPKMPSFEESLYKERSVDITPNGYPRLGVFIATTGQSHLIFRRFNYLQARVLLNLQDQLSKHEKELDALDEHCTSARNWEQASDNASRCRFALLQKIEDKFERYIALMNHVSRSALREKPSETHFTGIRNFFIYHKPDIEKYHFYKDDLMSLKPRGDTSGMDTWLMKVLLQAPHRIIRKHGSPDAHMVTHSSQKIMFARAVLLSVPMIILLVGPIYPLYHLSQGEMTERTLVGIMFIQLGFTCTFACCLKYLTRPKRHELFAGTVALVLSFPRLVASRYVKAMELILELTDTWEFF
ncbi:hypothetical protein M434DRAFT_12026 [Hypoxylon sp. CO27-5]|nr:hypothetical protein M434DRAFT_12026 [Hypoxylon sp. CO27-5]